MSELKKLTFSELDALNVCLRGFEGKFNSVDLSIASINSSVVRDLEDGGYLRKRWIGWEITRKGRDALTDADIYKFSDTRKF